MLLRSLFSFKYQRILPKNFFLIYVKFIRFEGSEFYISSAKKNKKILSLGLLYLCDYFHKEKR